MRLLSPVDGPAAALERRPSWQVLYWLFLAAVLGAIKSAHVLESDEGLVLEGAWNLLNGRQLYIDSFQIVTPGAFYAIYWAWKAFGAHYAVAQLVGICAILLAAVAIYRTGALLAGSSALAYVGPALYVLASATWPAINHNSFNAALLAWALFFAVATVERRSIYRAALAGIFTALAMLVAQHKGGAMFVAVAGFLAYEWRREKSERAAAVLAAYALASLLPLACLLAWPLPVLFESLVEYPLFRYRDVNRAPLVPLLVAAGYALLAWRVTKKSAAVHLSFVVQAFLLATTLQRPDLAHTFLVSFPMLALIPLMREGTARLARSSRGMRYVCAGAVIAFVAYVGSFAAVHAVLAWRVAGLGGRVLTYVRERCATVYAGPFLPGLYYETRKLNPTSYPYLLTRFNTEAQFEDAKRQLARARPGCAVLNYGMAGRFGYSRDNPVDRYLVSRYAPVLTEAGVTVYVARAEQLVTAGDGVQRR